MHRRSFLTTAALAALAATLSPSASWAIGPSSRFSVALLQYEGNWNPRPSALRKMLQEVEKRTSISVDTQPTPVLLENRALLLQHPLLFWSGDTEVPALSEQAVLNLRAFLKAGGTLIVDSAQGTADGSFLRSVRAQLERVLPQSPLISIPSSHVLYKSFFLIPEPVGRVASSKRMEGIFDEHRALVLLSHNDLFGAWARDNIGQYPYDVFPGGARQREMAYRLGINLVMYTLCLNYKEDQVHIPFILKRRRWKVD